MSNNLRLESFDPQRIRWKRFCQQIKFYLKANKVEEELKLSTVLTLIGDYAFNLLCDLIAPDLPENKTVEEIFDILDRHLSPKPIARTERFKFRSRKQKQEESLTEYVAALRKLTLDCSFKDSLDLHLADQFVYGLANTNIQKRLLIEPDDIPFEKLIQIAIIAEMATKDLASVNVSPTQSNEILKLQLDNNSRSFIPFTDNKDCFHCGKPTHASSNCKFRNSTCLFCKKRGHISSICRSRRNKDGDFKLSTKSREIHVLERNQHSNQEDEPYVLDRFTVKKIDGASIQPFMIKLKVNNVEIDFEIDTGASISLIPAVIYNNYLPFLKLEKTNVVLSAFNHSFLPIGKIYVDISFKEKVTKGLELYVVKQCSTPLLGRAWFKALNLFQGPLFLKQCEISTFTLEDKLKNLQKKYEKLFSPGLGCIKNFKAHLHIKEEATAKFCKARPVPFALLPLIETELTKLQDQGILSPVRFSDWAAPIVPILKKDNSLRICGDYKVGLNPFLKVDQYPLPIIDEILCKLTGGTIFTKLDMAQAYQQVIMDEKSSKYLTINTHKGLFQVHRLPFGIASVPAIFQELMDRILTGLPNTIFYLDDILIASPDAHTHLQDLERVLKKLSEAGIHLNLSKCEFLCPEIEYLGHHIDKNGICASPNKIKAILNAPEPSNSDQLRSFLGLISYYRKFLPNLATTLAPLQILICKNTKWNWSPEAKQAFLRIKEAVSSTDVLTHYDPTLPLIVASDASPTGLGAVLSHLYPNGVEKPIAFASRTLTIAERNYSQIDKEALAIIFSVKKFHQFLFGRKFTLLTDHKPLTHIFKADNPVPILAAARIQRWALLLSAYSYDIKYRPSKENSNADALSRSPCPDQKLSIEEIPEDSFLINHVESFPFSYQEIASETKTDPTLSQILQFTKNGWPKGHVVNNIIPFRSRKDEIFLQQGCLMWGQRILIPLSLRKLIIQELHRHHTGIVKMKLLARTIFWWPRLDKDIEDIALNCETCTLHADNPPKATLHPWIRPDNPWDRIHIDFAGPIIGHSFLITVDAYSKWPEVHMMSSTDTIHTAKALENYFSHYGYPLHIVSDNGPQFRSEQFKIFCKNRGIHHTFAPPYHPASNGQAERFVRILKSFIKKINNLNNLKEKIDEFLFSYRSTPHVTTGRTPAELFLGRTLRNRLHLIKPPQYKMYTDTNTLPTKSFKIGQRILSKSFSKKTMVDGWIPGIIKRIYTPVTYLVEFQDGKYGKRHVDQIRPSRLPNTTDNKDLELVIPELVIPGSQEEWPIPHDLNLDSPRQYAVTPDPPEPSGPPHPRYPTRIKHPPERLITVNAFKGGSNVVYPTTRVST